MKDILSTYKVMCWGVGREVERERRYSTTVSWSLVLLLLQCVMRPIGGNPIAKYREKQDHVNKPYYRRKQRPTLSFLETNIGDDTEGHLDNEASLQEFYHDPVVQGDSVKAEFKEIAFQWLMNSSSKAMVFEESDKKSIVKESEENHFLSILCKLAWRCNLLK